MIKSLVDIYRYCEGDITQIENFDKAINDRSDLYSNSNWVCHHRLETHNLDGSRRDIQQSRDDLKALDLYYHRPPNELIFLTREEHNRVHSQGRRLSKVQVEYMTKRTQKPVRCIETDMVFSSVREAAEWANEEVSITPRANSEKQIMLNTEKLEDRIRLDKELISTFQQGVLHSIEDINYWKDCIANYDRKVYMCSKHFLEEGLEAAQESFERDLALLNSAIAHLKQIENN